MKVRRDVFIILILAAIPAVWAGLFHPRRPTWTLTPPAIEQVSVESVVGWATPVLWVDAREASAFAQGHVPSAVSLNETEWEQLLPSFLEVWQPGRRVVVYCSVERCNASEEVARRLQRELNLTNVFVLKGGWSAWTQRRR